MQVSGVGLLALQAAQARAAGRSLDHEPGAVVEHGDLPLVRVPGQDQRDDAVQRGRLLRVVHQGDRRRFGQGVGDVGEGLPGLRRGRRRSRRRRRCSCRG